MRKPKPISRKRRATAKATRRAKRGPITLAQYAAMMHTPEQMASMCDREAHEILDFMGMFGKDRELTAIVSKLRRRAAALRKAA